MKPMVKRIRDAHSFSNNTKRKQENKTPKSAACRVSTKTAYRQKARHNLRHQLKQWS